jgi:hypothetical protein
MAKANPHKPTRRAAIRLSLVAALSLLLGAVTTLGVAWSIVLRTDWMSLREPERSPASETMSQSIGDFRLIAQLRLVGFETELIGPGIHWASDRSLASGARWAAPNLQAGWPALALDSESPGGPRRVPWRFISWTAGVSAPGSSSIQFHECLPVNPLFPGFAADTALYAAAWYLLLFTPLPLYRAARRRSRLSRGLCPACAYDLNASPPGPCPECGGSPGASP